MQRKKFHEEHPPFKDPALQTLVSLENKIYTRTENVLILASQHSECGQWLNMTKCRLLVHDTEFPSAEHLYQAMRFPRRPDIQRGILQYPSPLIAKRWCAKYKDVGRSDWYEEKVWIMWWLLHLKETQHYDTLGSVLDATQDKILLETSPDGDFWGVAPIEKGNTESPLRGANCYGQLLMKLRAECRKKTKDEMLVVDPPAVPGSLLFDKPIERIDCRKS